MDIQQTLEKYRDHLEITTKLGSVTKRNYVNLVRRFLYHIAEKKGKLTFGINDINRFLAYKNQGEKSGHTYRPALKHFIICINKIDWQKKLLKVKQKPRKKVFQFIQKSTVTKIINNLEMKYRKIAFLQLHTGMRWQEVFTLKFENIDWNKNERSIIIYLGYYAKGQKARQVYLNKKYIQQLKQIVGNTRAGFIFMTDIHPDDKDEIEKQIENWEKYYDRALKKAAVEYGVIAYSAHYIRHNFCDYFLKAGGKMEQLQRILGHKDVGTTIRYVQGIEEDAEQAILNM